MIQIKGFTKSCVNWLALANVSRHKLLVAVKQNSSSKTSECVELSWNVLNSLLIYVLTCKRNILWLDKIVSLYVTGKVTFNVFMITHLNIQSKTDCVVCIVD